MLKLGDMVSQWAAQGGIGFAAASAPVAVDDGKKKKKIKDPNAPKRPLTACTCSSSFSCVMTPF